MKMTDDSKFKKETKECTDLEEFLRIYTEKQGKILYKKYFSLSS